MAEATTSTFQPKRPGLNLALDHYHGRFGAIPGSEEANRADTPDPEPSAVYDEDDDFVEDYDHCLTEERIQFLLDRMDTETRARYDAEDEVQKDFILFGAHLDLRVIESASDNANADEVDEPEDEPQFPSAVVEEEWKSNTITLRERSILTFIDLITDKPDWNVKVNDEAIVAKWKVEAQSLPAEAIPAGFSDAMFDFAISELRDKAKIFEKYNGTVSVFDAAAVVFKHDVLTTDKELHAALKAAVKPLEDVPEKLKDWHPGSDEKVLDLVHPSLWPLVYGKSRVLRDRTIRLDQALASVGAGDVIPVPELELGPDLSYCTPAGHFFSKKFQWLPAEVEVDGNKAKVASYINNLHPIEHAPIYSIVGRLIEKALPLWDATYDRVMTWQKTGDHMSRTRIPCKETGRRCTVPEICNPDGNGYCEDFNRPEEDRRDDEEQWQADDRWYNETHPVTQPEPPEYKYIGPTEFKTSGPWFNGKKNLQVIVKFANIHLTPEKPSYDGGSWHIEGQLNERICATALFYYDNTNITDSHLSFRTVADAEEMAMCFEHAQCDYVPFKLIYGMAGDLNGDSTLMEHGRVLTREGRMLVFPNIYQHRVGSFELADKTKVGHRKIVALFLVDPATPVISTANVPPQQQHWNPMNDMGGRLPAELAAMVNAHLDCPYPIDEAKRFREELIGERKALDIEADEMVTYARWNFCEH